MQQIVDIRKFRAIIGKAACGSTLERETYQGLTIEQTLDHLLDCLVPDDSFHRQNPNAIRHTILRVRDEALKGL